MARTKPTPAARPTLYGFYVTLGQRFIFQRFDGIVPAKHFVLKMIANNEFVHDVWSPATGISEPMIRTTTGLTIRGPHLSDVIDYTLTGDDHAFTFPQSLAWYDTWALRGTEDLELRTIAPTTTTTPTTETAPKPKAEAKPKVDKTGLVTVQQICADNKWDPKHARAALRKANIEKPEAGWAFPPSQVTAITKAIKDNLK